MHGWFHLTRPGYGCCVAVRRCAIPAVQCGVDGGQGAAKRHRAIAYIIGVLSCVYHLANGIWTMGITWGMWTSPAAQSRAFKVCAVFGILLGIVSMSALGGMRTAGSGEEYKKAVEIENKMYEAKVQSGEVLPDEHKRSRKSMREGRNKGGFDDGKH